MNKTAIKEQIEQLRQELAPLANAMDYDEGSYLLGQIDALEWVLEPLEKE